MIYSVLLYFEVFFLFFNDYVSYTCMNELSHDVIIMLAV